MGTSRGYNAPTDGNWPSLKRQVSQYGGGDGGDPLPPQPDPNQPFPIPNPNPPDGDNNALQIFGNYIQAIGSSRSGGSGSGNSGGGGGSSTGGGNNQNITQTIGRAATRVGRNLGSFVTLVTTTGLAEALRQFNLAELIGRSAKEVTLAIVERLSGPGSTMEEDLARIALNKLRQELLGQAKTFEDVEQTLARSLEQIQIVGLVINFYGYYLFERFRRDFYERLRNKVGADRAKNSIERIRRAIFSSLRAKVAKRSAEKIDWRGKEGQQLAERVFQETLRIFEVD
jgi:hypothetical protein